MQRRNQCIEVLELGCQPVVLCTVRVPAAGFDHGDARPVLAGKKAGCQLAQAGAIQARPVVATVHGHAARVHGGSPESMQLRIALVEPGHAQQQVVTGLGQGGRRVGGHFRRPAQRHGHGGREGNGLLPVRQLGDQAVEPAVLDLVGRAASGFQHVLAVEMRAVTVGRCDRVHEQRLALGVEPAGLGQ